MRSCPRCGSDDHDANTLFCPVCGKLFSREDLQRVRVMGAIGVAHSSSPKIEEFWHTGDPNVFDRP